MKRSKKSQSDRILGIGGVSVDQSQSMGGRTDDGVTAYPARPTRVRAFNVTMALMLIVSVSG
jgi:hypothetical protein